MRNFRLGGRYDGVKAISPPNTGLGRYAQARLDNTVARAVARHREALRVDGVQMHIWVRRRGSLVCTCRQTGLQAGLNSSGSIIPTDGDTIEELRQPRQAPIGLPLAGEAGDQPFQIFNMRGRTSLMQYDELPDADVPENVLDNQPNDTPLDIIDSDTSDEDLARMMSEGGLYGGDKTPCGICFMAGMTNAYQLATGRRLVLDASNEWLYELHGGAVAQGNKYPTQFSISGDPDCTVVWTVDFPAFTNGWLAIAVRNNLAPANDCVVEWLVGNQWQPLTLNNLAASEGTDRTAQKIRVRTTSEVGNTERNFTHVELIYSTATPILGQLPQITTNTNYDYFQPTLTAEMEILAAIDEIPRESIIQDSKLKQLWKVLDSTPKMTASGQIFGFDLNVRNVHNNEPYYALRIITDPLVSINYRGIERVEGGLTEEYWPESEAVQEGFTMPASDGDSYSEPE